jgi:predicted dehydrogenase
MSEMLRCAVIGTGSIGLDHLSSLSHCPRACAVAIADNHADRVKEAADRFKIARSYIDYRDVLDQPDIDAVTIAVPNHLHARIAIDALKARKHVLLEKPMATNAKDALKILETARKVRRMVMVAQNMRFDSQVQMARALIERGELGEIYHTRAFWLRRAGIPRIGSWFTQKQLSGGGSLCDLGVHLLDLALHLMGEFEVRSVTAQTFSKFGPRGMGEMDWGKSEIDTRKPFDVEDNAVALLRLKSGRSLILESGWAGFHNPDQREIGIDLLGTQGGLSLFPARQYRNGSNGYETVHLMLARLPHSEDRVQHFVSSVLENKKPLVPAEQSVKVQQILDALYNAAATGREVRLGK